MTDVTSLLAPIGATTPTPLDRAHLVERCRLTLVGVGQALLGIPVALALGILWLLALPLSFITLGAFLALGAVPAARAVADVHRRVSGALLADEIPSGYADTSGQSFIARLWTWLRDPARWRDFAFLWFSATGGFVLSAVPALLLLSPVAHLIIFLVDPNMGWMFLLFLSGPLLVAWWLTTPHLMRARALADRGILGHARVEQLERRVEQVEGIRAETLDHQAAEVRRIERDLHDGAQTRIAAVGMTVGLAERLLTTDPEAAAALLREARESTVGALEDMRSVVRGIHPPALADRGLSGAIEALVVPIPLPVTVSLDVPRLPAPIESAAYFAVAECVANLAKHSGATRGWVTGGHDGERLRLLVGDDGRGGADLSGGGLSGVARRLEAFDGAMSLTSPAGGGTVVRMEIPCPT
jgi:signal transduction histidine kinase